MCKIAKGLRKTVVTQIYGITPSTFSTLLKDIEKIERLLHNPGIGFPRKQTRLSQIEDVDKAVCRWFKDVNSRNVPVSGHVIRGKAPEIRTVLMIEIVIQLS